MIWVGTLALLIASAKIQVPMAPVPITLQTAVVLALPCLFGTRMALTIIGTYLMIGFMGAPVFAVGAGAGPAYFLGPTGGYLAGFFIAALIIGKIYEVLLEDKGFINLTGIIIAGHAIILALGVLWLAYGLPALGLEIAFMSGFVPFMSGTAVKSLMAAAFIKAFKK